MEKLSKVQAVGKIKIDPKKCKGCQLCIKACPKGLIGLDKSLNKRGVHPVYFMVRNFKTSGTTLACQNTKPGQAENCTKVIAEGNFLEDGGCTGCALCAQICPECCIEVFKGDD